MDKQHKKPRRLLVVLAAVGLALGGLLILAAALTVAAQLAYRQRVYLGVSVGDLRLGGKNLPQTKIFLKEATAPLAKGVVFSYGDKQVVISPESVAFDAGLAYQLFSYDSEATARLAWVIGRGENWLNNLRQQWICLMVGCRVSLVIESNQPKILELLRQEFSSLESPVSNAALVWQGADNWQIKKEQGGRQFAYQAALEHFLENLKQVKREPIKLVLQDVQPQIFQAQVGDVSAEIERLLSAAPLTLTWQDERWTASRTELKRWLDLVVLESNPRKIIGVDVSEGLLKKYLDATIAPRVNRAPLAARFAMQDGRATMFQAARDGQEIDVTATADELRQAVAAGKKEVELKVKITPAEDFEQRLSDMGIVEIIGTGTSSFAGSPVNRRHNIKVGAAALNGLLIAPGEEFSLLKALGEVDAKAGYLPELVIKQNKTIPEYGGGLCQIGTTTFRTVIASGLPVTMRRNHSYRVQYYEPAGTDATIYSPWPDFKFINDSGSTILIQTRLEGNILIFDFWGRRDGRQVNIAKPTIYNIVKPPPTKIVETLDLKPGEKKCTEKAHNGASAYFDYKVVYPNGEIKQERFSSHYVPWQEVCLLGVEKLSEPGATESQLPPVNPDAANVVAPTSTGR